MQALCLHSILGALPLGPRLPARLSGAMRPREPEMFIHRPTDQ